MTLLALWASASMSEARESWKLVQVDAALSMFRSYYLLYTAKRLGCFLNLLGHVTQYTYILHYFASLSWHLHIYDGFWSLWICKSCFRTTSMFTLRGCTRGEVQAQYRLASRIFEAYIHHFVSFRWPSSQRPRGLFVLPRYWATCTANDRYGLNMTLPSQSAFPGFALYISHLRSICIYQLPPPCVPHTPDFIMAARAPAMRLDGLDRSTLSQQKLWILKQRRKGSPQQSHWQESVACRTSPGHLQYCLQLVTVIGCSTGWRKVGERYYSTENCEHKWCALNHQIWIDYTSIRY